MPPRVMSAVGIVIIVGSCFLISNDRNNIRWSLTFWGLILQYTFALIILKTYPEHIFAAAQTLFTSIYSFADYGARFLFGSLVENKDFIMLGMGSVIIFVSSTMAVLTYLRILPAIIYALAALMQRTMRTSGAETLAAAMFVFMGIEVITGIKTVIGRMTRSDLLHGHYCRLGYGSICQCIRSQSRLYFSGKYNERTCCACSFKNVCPRNRNT